MTDTERESLENLAAAYALGALSPEDKEEFETFLAASPEVQRDVAEFREVGALLALGADADQPSPALRARVLARISEEKERPLPATSTASHRPHVMLYSALAASLIAAVGFGLRTMALSQQLTASEEFLGAVQEQLAGRETTLNRILEPGVQLYLLTTDGDQAAGIQFFWDRTRNVVMLHAFNLFPVPEGRAYQLWLIPEDGAPVPSRVFNSEPDGHALIQEVPIPDGRYRAAAITVEPAAGSDQPTSTPLLVASLVS